MTSPRTSLGLCVLALLLAAVPAVAADPYKGIYASYKPDFIEHIEKQSGWQRALRGWKRTEKEMQLSYEKGFFTLNMIHEDQRANALVAAALKKEAQGQYREALKIYQLVIDKYPRQMYRVSDYGVFVPASQYCQRRILRFPAGHLAFYRTLHDPRAKEAFESARRRYSLLGLSDVVDTMLATTYGGKAVMELGSVALDTGHFLAALEYFTVVSDFFTDKALHTPELALKVAYCRKMLGRDGAAAKAPTGNADLARFRKVVESARYTPPPFHSQLTSAPNLAADDYTLLAPTADPRALKPPTWKAALPGSRRDFFVYTHPVVTRNSVIYRHKNIVYCRSILNGELRWKNDVGGRAVWQNWQERQYPQEDVLVQDGLAFTAINKAGPSLVALDEVTGQLKWAYGPMVASNPQEARMRFEAAPTGGPRTVYAGYVLDNIEGETHTDTEYGVIALESATGRVQWRSTLCRLQPGKFAGGFAERRRNRIRSFTSPPLYHQGTVYYTTNAGAVAAMDALSGRVKWLMRYPYSPGVHDATREFGKLSAIHGGTEHVRPHFPMFWLNQRPLLVGERVYLLPVDSKLLLCVDRRTGKVLWSRPKSSEGFNYLVGPIASGELVLVNNGRNAKVFGSSHASGPPIELLDAATGKTVWKAPDLILRDDQPVMKHYRFHSPLWFSMNTRWFENGARPLLTRDGKLYVTCWTDASVYWRPGCHVFHLTGVDLIQRKIDFKRRYYTPATLTHAEWMINEACPQELKDMEELPSKSQELRDYIGKLKEVIADTVPQNEHGPFMPFSRVTAQRYGVQFELRFGPRAVEMVYDRQTVHKALSGKTDPVSDFARAELAVADARFADAAALLKKCLATMSSEDLDFRAAVNQHLYRVHQHLARQAIRSSDRKAELANALGMSRTASTLAEEIETLFAVSEAYQRAGDAARAARSLQTVIGTYGNHEVPISPLALAQREDREKVLAKAAEVMEGARPMINRDFFGRELGRSLTLMEQALPLYLSTVSPLPKRMTARAGELASARLIGLQKLSKPLAAALEKEASADLSGKSADEQLQRLWEFPATRAAQRTLEALLAEASKSADADARRRMWRLADAARISGLQIPPAYRKRLLAPPPAGDGEDITLPQDAREHEFTDTEGAARLVLERRGDRTVRPEMLFTGSRVRKRLDNKFALTAVDLKTGKTLWRNVDMRLKGTGQEPGFFEAFVHGDRVIVHGLYDVLAFDIGSGKLGWRYRVPFDFEIADAVLSGDLLVLSGKTETIALYVATDSPDGEVAWQVKELGDVYTPLYMRGDRLITVRKLPFNVTVRFRATGKLIGRLDLPDLSLHKAHPLLEGRPDALPVAHADRLLVVTDGWYYILIDTDALKVLWKRLIDQNDVTREPAMRFALSRNYILVLKEDYDQKAIYMLDAHTGSVLWRRDPKDATGPQPMHSSIIDGDRAYGVEVHPGQGFYLRGVDCKTGKVLFRTEVKDYQGKPTVRLRPRQYGRYVVAEVQQGRRFELRVFDVSQKGKLVYTLMKKGDEAFGVHGRVSGTIQNGRVILLSKDKLGM